MKRISLIIILISIVFCGLTSAQYKGTGIGVILAKPTGLNLKVWNRGNSAFVFGLAWSSDDDSWHIHADYILHSFNLIRGDRKRLAFYYGIGGRVTEDEKDLRAGVRIPLGINYFFKSVPLDLFFEFVPVFDLTPATDLQYLGGFGIRYFF